MNFRPKFPQALANLISQQIKLAEISGLSIALVSDDGTITEKQFGVDNKDDGQALNENILFEACSLSKPVFAYLLLKMLEKEEYKKLFGDFDTFLDTSFS